MDYFYIIVSSILVIFLILILTYYGIVLQNKIKGNTAYPPQPPAQCPDYWTLADDGTCNIPVIGSKNSGTIYNGNTIVLSSSNTFGLNSTNTKIDFNNSSWSAGATGAVCKQSNWSKKYNIMWDGVTNYNGCQ
jgi:hypothetical protein